MSGGIGSVNDCPARNAQTGRSEVACVENSGAGTAYQSSLEFLPLPTAIPCARLHTRNLLAEWHLSDIAVDGELIVSELMTNALQASRPDLATIALRLRADSRFLLIEVWDRSPDDPDPAMSVMDSEDSEHGRGLTIVKAFSHRWGFYRTSAYMKVVWAELVIPAAGAFLP
jgi:anti-sigma regulatory factor (Ser/Thr protein kinase)